LRETLGPAALQQKRVICDVVWENTSSIIWSDEKQLLSGNYSNVMLIVQV